MYAALMLICAVIAVGLFWLRRSRHRRIYVLAGALFGLLVIGFFSLLDFWGEFLWFKVLGYSDRFWTSVTAMLGLSLAGCIFGALLSWGWPGSCRPGSFSAAGWPCFSGPLSVFCGATTIGRSS